ncbi:DUF4267 domain-containing protein [Arcticibacter sp.]|uniref:DUF4267 domain-containing protein n=1 Tax=Arcticibacter sp. TaxID=1872630 RepID=UPI00388ECA9F
MVLDYVALINVKGIRDIFSGIVLLPVFFTRMRNVTAWVFAMSILIPVGDCLVVYTTNGAGDLELWINS